MDDKAKLEMYETQTRQMSNALVRLGFVVRKIDPLLKMENAVELRDALELQTKTVEAYGRFQAMLTDK